MQIVVVKVELWRLQEEITSDRTICIISLVAYREFAPL